MGVTAQHLLTALFNAGIAISIGATVLSLGMTYTAGPASAECVAPPRARRDGASIVDNFVGHFLGSARAWAGGS
jgi:hypothetical protein